MCGIAGVYLRDPNFEVDLDGMLTELLDRIEHRGRHATGFVAIGDDGVLQWQKAAVNATKFNVYRQRVPEGTRVLLGHTRFATQGDAGFMENNHPIKRGPFFIIHNGVLANDNEVFRKSERARYGQVDSEAIAARLASFGDLCNLKEVMEELDGSTAVAAVDERFSNRLAVARGRVNPLFVYEGKRIVIFASTTWAIEKAHEKHVGRMGKGKLYELKDGEMLEWLDGEPYTYVSFKPVEPVYTYTSPYTGKHSAGSKAWDSKEWDKPWDISKGKNPITTSYSTSEQKQLPVASTTTEDGKEKLGEREENASNAELDIAICENCDTPFEDEDEVNYYREPNDNVTYFVCEDCFERLAAIDDQEAAEKAAWDSDDEDIWDAVQRDWENRSYTLTEIEDDESGIVPIDDFDGANTESLNIVTRFFRGFI